MAGFLAESIGGRIRDQAAPAYLLWDQLPSIQTADKHPRARKTGGAATTAPPVS